MEGKGNIMHRLPVPGGPPPASYATTGECLAGMTEKEYIALNMDHLFRFWMHRISLIGAGLFMMFTTLDYVSTRNFFYDFLYLRIGITVVLLVVSYLSERLKNRNAMYILGYITVILASAVIEYMILKLGGHASRFYVGIILLVIVVLGFVPARFSFHLVSAILIYGIYLVPILVTERIIEYKIFFTTNFFLLSIIMSSLLLRYLSNRSLENEFRLRHEMEQYKKGLEELVEGRSEALSEAIEKVRNEMKERSRMEEALRKAANDWRATFDSTRDMIMMLDRQGRIIKANRSASLFLDTGYREMIGRSAAELFVGVGVPEDVIPLAEMMRNRSHEEREVFIPAREVWLVLSVDPILDESGKLAGAVFTVRDITALKKAEEEKSELQMQLLHVQKMDSIGRLAGGIAHDFNNILSAILGYSELAMLKLPENDPVRENIRQVHNAGERAASLTRQLLALSRRQVLEMRIVNLNEIIGNMSRMLARMIGEDISLETDIQRPVSPILADPGQIEQVLMNLAVNARDAMPAGGRLIIETADIRLEEEHVRGRKGLKAGDYVMLSVTDTGEGMTREVQERIFEPFFTTKDRGAGTGLGLATVYGIVGQHNGYIEVASEPGKGTTFTIYFPPAHTLEEMTGETEEHQPVLKGGTESIMVVDDDASIRKLAASTLRPLGYRVHEASNGEEALKLFRKRNGEIDLLLTDVIMPVMNGKELAERLCRERPSLRVVFMSGYASEAIEHYNIPCEREVFIQKPITPIKLTNRIREALENHGPDRNAKDEASI